MHQGGVGAFNDQIQQRVDAALQAQLAQLLHGGQRVAGLQELEHFVEHAALRHLLQQVL